MTDRSGNGPPINGNLSRSFLPETAALLTKLRRFQRLSAPRAAPVTKPPEDPILVSSAKFRNRAVTPISLLLRFIISRRFAIPTTPRGRFLIFSDF